MGKMVSDPHFLLSLAPIREGKMVSDPHFLTPIFFSEVKIESDPN
jgi:hypothetical protein